ncbi:hypothetical protein ARC272_19160 [Pantoea ananatis]|nr:hypothetical protein ARC272_19160 [Pantoea ananatis]
MAVRLVCLRQTAVKGGFFLPDARALFLISPVQRSMESGLIGQPDLAGEEKPQDTLRAAAVNVGTWSMIIC